MTTRSPPGSTGALQCAQVERAAALYDVLLHGELRTCDPVKTRLGKIRLPGDRIIRIFAHQNSVRILSEFCQNSEKILKFSQKF